MKKFLALLLALVMAFALVSCGGEETNGPTANPENDETEIEVSVDNDTTEEKEEEVKEEKPEKTPEPEKTPAPEKEPEASKAPEKNEESAKKSVGNTLLDAFKKENPSSSALSIAEKLISHEIIAFMGGAVEVEEGFLSGFDNTEIKGFKEGAMFCPMIGTVPFVGYVFTLDGSVSAGDFINNLKSSANLRWNICTKADEMVTGSNGDKVFFVMCPTAFEEAPVEE